jgi:hypothetical protein
MRYQPAEDERAAPQPTRAGIALPWPIGAPRGRAHSDVGSRQTAELDIWEDEGGTTSGRAPRYPGRQVDSKLHWNFEQLGDARSS